MKRYHFALWSILFLTGISLPLSAQDEEVVNRLFSEAIVMAEGGNLDSAIVLMNSVIRIYPYSANAYWNLGIWYTETEEYEKGLETWQKLRSIDSTDWEVLPRLIQTYQALNDTLHRNEEREKLFALWESGTDSSLSSKEMYCCDQFFVDDQYVLSYETFAPSGERMIFYTFYLVDASYDILSRFSLGSYDMTTQIAREVGEIAEDERIYHLDEYGEGDKGYSHATWGMYRVKPTYEQVKGFVSDAIRGETEPASSSFSR